MNTLLEIYNKHKKGDWPDKNSTHSYVPIYEKILAPYRETAKNILEIGLMSGESLRMWAEYFSGNVYGIDCDLKPLNGLADLSGAIADGMNIVIGDATKEQDIEKFFSGMKFSVVFDDGNHVTSCQIQTFELLKNKMEAGGIYIIEDCADIDNDRDKYLALHSNVEIVDRRHIKGRFDDVIVLIHF